MAEKGQIFHEKERADLRSPVPPIVVKLNNGHEDFFGTALNISRSGMLLQTPAPLSDREELKIEFTLPELNAEVICRSKVVWNHRSFFPVHAGLTKGGINFVDMDPALAEEIDRRVRNHSFSHNSAH